jgi:hypothetical protein
VTNQQLVREQIKERKWQWIGHLLRRTNAVIEKSAVDSSCKGVRR